MLGPCSLGCKVLIAINDALRRPGFALLPRQHKGLHGVARFVDQATAIAGRFVGKAIGSGRVCGCSCERLKVLPQ
jgi:hypothetical protein